MKVLVLSPGQPSSLNSGLGTAANALIKELGKVTDLVVVQPDNVDSNVDKLYAKEIKIEVDEEAFSEKSIAQQNVQITVSSYLDPYHYGSQLKNEETITKEEEIEIRNELIKYSKQVIIGTKKVSFDLIYAHDWITLQAAVKLKKETGKPIVVHIHSLDYDRGATEHSTFVHDIEYEGLRQADAIIAVSQYTRDVLVSHYDVDPKKISVVNNAIEHFETSKPSKRSSEKLILFVGRMIGQKGPELFLEIADRLIKKRDDVRFVMVGGGALLHELIQKGQDPMRSGKIHFTGDLTRKEVFEFYARSSVYCMPSVSEPFGLSALEAAQAGVPVVLSHNCGAAEVLKGSYLADISNVDSFVKQIDMVIDDKEMREKSVDLNLKCISNTSWEKASKQVNAVFEGLLG